MERALQTLFVLKPPAWHVDQAREVCAELGDGYRLPRRNSSVHFETTLFTSIDASTVVLEHVRSRQAVDDGTGMATALPADFTEANTMWAELDAYFLDAFWLSTLDGTDFVVSGADVIGLGARIRYWQLLAGTVLRQGLELGFSERDVPRVFEMAQRNLAKTEQGLPVVRVREGQALR